MTKQSSNNVSKLTVREKKPTCAYSKVRFSLVKIVMSLLFGSGLVILGYFLLGSKQSDKLLKTQKSGGAGKGAAPGNEHQTIRDAQPKAATVNEAKTVDGHQKSEYADNGPATVMELEESEKAELNEILKRIPQIIAELKEIIVGIPQIIAELESKTNYPCEYEHILNRTMDYLNKIESDSEESLKMLDDIVFDLDKKNKECLVPMIYLLKNSKSQEIKTELEEVQNEFNQILTGINELKTAKVRVAQLKAAKAA
ncbi:hypothetical protein GINT2_001305 [Glugoides intestinalis]